MSDFSEQEVEELRRLLQVSGRKQALGDMASDDFFEETWDRPHMIGALVTLAPKDGEQWNERALEVWLQVVEKTARLVYGLGVERPKAPPPPETPAPPPAPEPEEEPGEDEPEPPPLPAPDDLREAVLAELAASPTTLSRSELEERLGADGADVNRAIQSLRADKRVEHCGRGRGTSYRIPARASNGKSDGPLAPRVVEVIARAPCAAPAILAETGVSMEELAPTLNVLVDAGEIVWTDDSLYAVKSP